MKIKDLLSPRAIRLNAPAESKSQAIDALVELHAAAGNLTDPSAYKAAILAREGQGTTAIGEGIAVPHAKSDSVAHAALAAMTVPGGVDYDAPDGKPSSLLFMIAAPPDGDVHLEILSRLMVMLMEPEFCDRLRGAKTAEEFIEIILTTEDGFLEQIVDEPVRVSFKLFVDQFEIGRLCFRIDLATVFFQHHFGDFLVYVG